MRDKSLRSGERQIALTLDGLEVWHRERYEEIIKYIKDKVVLDIGCGIGFGSYILAEYAKKVYGLDDSEEAINFARVKYPRPNIIYCPMDFLHFEDDNIDCVDVVVAYEFLEHIENTDKLFNVFSRIKSPELFIISTPHLKCPLGSNKFHYRHYGMDEIIHRFWNIGYKPKRAEIVYFGNSMCNFYVGEKKKGSV